MAQVIYTGTTDTRTLDAGDLKSLGVEGFKKTVFVQHQPTEVEDGIAEVLVSRVGDFEVLRDSEQPTEPEQPAQASRGSNRR